MTLSPIPPRTGRPAFPPRRTANPGTTLSVRTESQVLPPENKISPVPSGIPELPDGFELGEIGMKVWCKVCGMFTLAGTFTEQMKGPLYTLCTLEEAAFLLRQEFMSNVVIQTVTGGSKVNPAMVEWGKVVAQLKNYYDAFQLTPKSVANLPPPPDGKGGSAIPNRQTQIGDNPDDIFKPVV